MNLDQLANQIDRRYDLFHRETDNADELNELLCDLCDEAGVRGWERDELKDMLRDKMPEPKHGERKKSSYQKAKERLGIE